MLNELTQISLIKKKIIICFYMNRTENISNIKEMHEVTPDCKVNEWVFGSAW